jgi:bifunctional ADP-heptose synthase (sugar kinase/adenylyltransferase)
LETLAQTVHEIARSKRTVAMCHRCFDILHVGYLRHLEAKVTRGLLLAVQLRLGVT